MPQQSSQEAQLQIGDQVITVRLKPLGSYETNPHNTNRGSERGVAAIEHSVQDTGWGRGIVVASDGTIVGGNHATEAAEATEAIEAWIEIETTGNVGVATRRVDWPDARSPEAIRAGLADNRTNQLNFNLDLTNLASDLGSLAEVNVSIPKLYYTPDELNKVLEPAQNLQPTTADQNPADLWVGMPEYVSQNQEAPYSVRVNFHSLIDMEHFAELVQQTITPKTKSINFPFIEPDSYDNHQYVLGDGMLEGSANE